MSIFVRIWLAFTLVLVIGGYLFFTNLEKHVKPTAQQVVEDTLIDTTRVLASLVQVPVQQHSTQADRLKLHRELSQSLEYAFKRHIGANIWNKHKAALSFHIYITDHTGRVIYDSTGKSVGEDFSRWNDVYLTLQGKYGARATRMQANDPTSSVMYVAAPIYSVHEPSRIIGVLTVGKPNRTLLPYLDRTYNNMSKTALWVGLASLVLAALVALWIRRSIHLVNRYTQSLATEANKPYFYLASELNDLSNSIETMRDELENKAYVTQYVHTLTHELKSPITAIQASSELLADELPEADRTQFSDNILRQCQKLQALVERLLLLAKLEQPNFKLNIIELNVKQFVTELVGQNQSKIHKNNLKVNIDIADFLSIQADKFWLGQALQNVLENAIHFSDTLISITAEKAPHGVRICIGNTGKHIPDYALEKLFDRYFSLPKDTHTSKGTGIGLTLVKEVLEKHGGNVFVQNGFIDNKPSVTVTLVV